MNSPQEPFCELSDFSFSYGEKEILKKLTLKICNGEKVALIGPSGAGKTTLLKYLQGLIPADTAVIHQTGSIISQLNVFHNVYMGRLDRHSAWRNIMNLLRPDPVIKGELLNILNQLQLQQKAFDNCSKLSGGEQQRVAIARALFRGGKYLLGDEPVASVDPHLAELIVDTLMKLEGTVILSLHSVELALKNAQRVLALKEGQIYFDLPATEVTQQQLRDLYSPC